MIVRRMYVTPRQVDDVTDPLVKYYAVLRCGAIEVDGRRVELDSF